MGEKRGGPRGAEAKGVTGAGAGAGAVAVAGVVAGNVPGVATSAGGAWSSY